MSTDTLLGPLVLNFTHDSPSYTALVQENAKTPTYKVDTDYSSGKHPVTTVEDAQGAFVASLEWHGYLPDVVQWKDESKTVKMGNWMRTRDGVSKFRDERGREYEWRDHGYSGNNAHVQMELFALDSPDASIASYKRLPRQVGSPIVPDEASRPQLILEPRAQELQDLCVASFLFLEKKRRISSQKKQDSIPFIPKIAAGRDIIR